MNVILFGPPGAGKSVQADLLHQNRDYQIISMGQLLRNAMKYSNPTSKLIRQIVGKGELVPNDICNDLLLRAIDPIRPIAFDGFPRSEDQLDILGNRHESAALIVLNADYDLIQQRLLQRGRHDDTASVIKNRYEVYSDKTLSLIHSLRQMYNIYDIDADQDPEIIHKRITQIIGD